MKSFKSLELEGIFINLQDNDLKYLTKATFPYKLSQNISNFTNLKSLCLKDLIGRISLNERFLEVLILLKELTLNSVFYSIDSHVQFLFKKMIKLKKLTLIFNKMNTLKSSCFNYLVDLKEVTLIFNEIKAIESDPFKNSMNLKYLDLSGNEDLKEIQKDVFKSNYNLERFKIRD